MKVAITSGCSSTGETTLSGNPAAYLTEEEFVVLSDFDVEETNSGLFHKGKLYTLIRKSWETIKAIVISL